MPQIQLLDGKKIDFEKSITGFDLTKKISKLHAIHGGNHEAIPESAEKLYHLRARILKQADAKPRLAARICIEHFKADQKWLVYSDSVEQSSRVKSEIENLAKRKSQKIHVFEYHSAMDSDRQETLAMFDITGGIVCAIKCLDEGVNIPNLDHALILASSQNPREFVQRRGRVLRKARNKDRAYIFDVLTVPQPSKYNAAVKRWAYAEIARALQFAKWAINKESAITMMEAELLRAQVLKPEDLEDTGVEFNDTGESAS